jgi:uncharacterized iron-regulated protein
VGQVGQVGRRDVCIGLGLLALLPACASQSLLPGADADGFDAGGAGSPVFLDTRTGSRLGRRRVASLMISAPVVLMGEVHDNVVHHEVRGTLLRDWLRGMPDRPAAIVFEHLDREHNDALRLAQKRSLQGLPRKRVEQGQPAQGTAARADMEALLDAGGFDRQGWGWPAHRPLFEAAYAGGGTWIAANLSRATAQQLARDPSFPVEPALQAVLESARWSEAAQQALARALTEGHCGTMPEAVVGRIIRVQRLRDAALALPLLDAGERRSLLLAGNGHVRRDHGVPRYLGALEKEALVIGFEEIQTPGDAGTGDLAAMVGAGRAAALAEAYDLVCLTRVPQRADPCAAAAPAAVNPAAPTQIPSR